MRGAQRFAANAELVLSGRLMLFAGESGGELAAVVGQQLADLHRIRALQPAQELHAAGFVLIGITVHVHPARSPNDGHEKVAPFALVRHLRQVLDVHVQRTGLVA